jgi:DNA transformation protein
VKPDPFRDFVLDQLRAVGSLECRAMFGGYGLYAAARFFGLINQQRFYLKTSPVTRRQFECAGMNCFQPNPQQKLGAYYEVPADILENPEELTRWANEAIAVATAPE